MSIGIGMAARGDGPRFTADELIDLKLPFPALIIGGALPWLGVLTWLQAATDGLSAMRVSTGVSELFAGGSR